MTDHDHEHNTVVVDQTSQNRGKEDADEANRLARSYQREWPILAEYGARASALLMTYGFHGPMPSA